MNANAATVSKTLAAAKFTRSISQRGRIKGHHTHTRGFQVAQAGATVHVTYIAGDWNNPANGYDRAPLQKISDFLTAQGYAVQSDGFRLYVTK